MRVVLDTNVLISAVLFGGTPRRLLDAAASGKIDSVTSGAILDEFTRVLQGKFEMPADRSATLRDVIESLSEMEHLDEVDGVVRDPGDDMVVATAISGQASIIVTGDQDLLDLTTLPGIEVVRPRDLLERLVGD